MLKLLHDNKILSWVFKKPSSLFTLQDTYELPYTVKSKLSFLKACDKTILICECFSMFLIIQTNFYFQGSHIWIVLDIYKQMATLKIKSDLRLLLRELKNHIYKFYF